MKAYRLFIILAFTLLSTSSNERCQLFNPSRVLFGTFEINLFASLTPALAFCRICQKWHTVEGKKVSCEEESQPRQHPLWIEHWGLHILGLCLLDYIRQRFEYWMMTQRGRPTKMRLLTWQTTFMKVSSALTLIQSIPVSGWHDKY